MTIASQLTSETANALIALAINKAKELDIKVCIAVCDAGAHLTAFYRMDGAFLGSIDVAQGKARTAVLFPFPTEQFGEVIRSQQLTGMELSNQGLVAFAGGLPIIANDKTIGAIGISGGSAEQDAEIAQFAVNHLID